MNEHNDVVDKGSIVIDGNRIAYCRAGGVDAGGSVRQSHRRRSDDRHAGHGERSLPLGGQSGARHDAEQAVGDLARLLPGIAARHARGRLLRQRAFGRHGDAQERRDHRARSFCRQCGVPLHGRGCGDPGDARSRPAPCCGADGDRQELRRHHSARPNRREAERRNQAHERQRSEDDPGLARRVRGVCRDVSRAGKTHDRVPWSVRGAALHR